MSERTRRPSLGRGLAALFGETAARVPAGPSAMRQVPIEAIRPSAFQPRRHFADAELDELAQSIREKGVLQPLLVRPLGEADEEVAFELIAGERRWRAAQRAGLHEVPVLLRALNDVEVLEIALVENLQREDLSALEEAEAYTRLMREFGRSQASLAEAVGKSRSHVANTIRLLSLPKSVRQMLERGALSPGHARALLALPDPTPAAEEVVNRGLNVRATEALVRRRVSRPGGATAAPARSPRDPNTAALERELTDALGLKVTVATRAGGGALTIEYSNLDQLDRILALLRRG
jgi:ParB family chromosome partitioning protein